MPKIKYVDRELRWLSFNYRVLQEVDNATVPLFERIKFLAIFSSNLDEFYRVRVAAIKSVWNTNGKSNFELNSLTNEIRSYLQVGDDKAVVNGVIGNSSILRIIVGKRKDEIVDDSEVQDYLWSFLPVKVSQNKTFICDSGKKTMIKQSSSTAVDESEYIERGTDEIKYGTLQEDRLSRWVYRSFLESDTDNGVIWGSLLSLNKYGFRVSPFDYQLNFFASYATVPKSFNLRLSGIFNSVIKNTSVKIELIAPELNLTKYFRYVNNKCYSVDLENENFYRLQQKLIEFKPSVNFSLFPHNTTSVKFSYSYRQQSLQNENLLNNYPYDRYGLVKFNLFSSSIKFDIDGRDNAENTQEGYYLSVNGSLFPKFVDNEETFYKRTLIYEVMP